MSVEFFLFGTVTNGSVDYWLQDLKVLFLITVKQVDAAEVFNQQLGLVGGPSKVISVTSDP